MAALAAITFIGNWNSFIWPLMINGQTPEAWTVQITLSTFITAQAANMAAAIAMSPIQVLFVFLWR